MLFVSTIANVSGLPWTRHGCHLPQTASLRHGWQADRGVGAQVRVRNIHSRPWGEREQRWMAQGAGRQPGWCRRQPLSVTSPDPQAHSTSILHGAQQCQPWCGTVSPAGTRLFPPGASHTEGHSGATGALCREGPLVELPGPPCPPPAVGAHSGVPSHPSRRGGGSG